MKMNLKWVPFLLIAVSSLTACDSRTNEAQGENKDTTLVDTRRNTNTTSNFLEDTSGKAKIEDQHQNQ